MLKGVTPMVSRVKMKGRATSGGFLSLPFSVLDSDACKMLTPQGVKLLIDVSRQYRGTNNGDLAATIKMLRGRGWKSSSTLAERIDELIHYGLIEKTRQGGKNQCSLYAVTWKPIDECRGKMDVKETRTASGIWKGPKNKWTPKRSRKIKSSGSQIELTNYDCSADRTNKDVDPRELVRRSNQSDPISPFRYIADRTPSYIYAIRSRSTKALQCNDEELPPKEKVRAVMWGATLQSIHHSNRFAPHDSEVNA